MIGQLGIVQSTNRQTKGKEINSETDDICMIDFVIPNCPMVID